MFHGNEAGIVPRFPSNIRCDKFGHFQHGFFNTASYYLNCLAISRFSDSPWDLEAKSWDRELRPQTASLTVKPWELAGLSSHFLWDGPPPIPPENMRNSLVKAPREAWCGLKVCEGPFVLFSARSLVWVSRCPCRGSHEWLAVSDSQSLETYYGL